MSHFRKYPSIGQFSNLVKNVRSHSKHFEIPLPKLTFKGVTKIHGTNAAVGFDPTTKEVWAQSRPRIITFESDNAGFAAFVELNTEYFRNVMETIPAEPGELVYLYGEWFGGNIQKGVAVSQLDKKYFGLFSLVTDVPSIQAEDDNESEDYQTQNTSKQHSLKLVREITAALSNVVIIDDITAPFTIDINFSKPEEVQNKLLELTLAVEAECPVGKYFGISGVGEGIVWTCTTNPQLMMKTKGEAHSASKVKTVRELTEAEIASKANATEFVEFACSENRMAQGIDKLKEMGLEIDTKSMGAYLKWLGNDILTECKDTLLQSGIERKDVMPRVADKGRNWFLTYINSHHE
jgi:hypothetical protein